MIKVVQEGLGGIRDVLLDGTQPVYCDIYRRADYPLRRAQGANMFISTSPRFAMEALGMVVIAALTYGLSRQAGGLATCPAGARSARTRRPTSVAGTATGYNAWSSIASCEASLAKTIELLDQPLPAELLQPAPAPLHFQDASVSIVCDSGTPVTDLGCWMTSISPSARAPESASSAVPAAAKARHSIC